MLDEVKCGVSVPLMYKKKLQEGSLSLYHERGIWNMQKMLFKNEFVQMALQSLPLCAVKWATLRCNLYQIIVQFMRYSDVIWRSMVERVGVEVWKGACSILFRGMVAHEMHRRYVGLS